MYFRDQETVEKSSEKFLKRTLINSQALTTPGVSEGSVNLQVRWTEADLAVGQASGGTEDLLLFLLLLLVL